MRMDRTVSSEGAVQWRRRMKRVCAASKPWSVSQPSRSTRDPTNSSKRRGLRALACSRGRLFRSTQAAAGVMVVVLVDTVPAHRCSCAAAGPTPPAPLSPVTCNKQKAKSEFI